MVIFSPWALGTSQPWAIRLMNGAGYSAGALLAVKLAIRRLKGYQPPRWAPAQAGGMGWAPAATSSDVSAPGHRGRGHGNLEFLTAHRLTATLALLTAAILLYCLTSALNARATYVPGEGRFIFSERSLPWLPHSFDSTRTWAALWIYLGLACSFWAVSDWLLGKTDGEARAQHRSSGAGTGSLAALLPARLRRLLWVLAINGGLLALEAVLQRLEGSGKLLFLIRPRVNPRAIDQFGPYAYRANAAQYFNLLWPVCLGFWWTLNRSLGPKQYAHHLVLVCCLVMAACPIISTSRAGAAVTVGIVLVAAVFLLATHILGPRPPENRSRNLTLAGLALFFTGALALGFGLGWKSLKPRLARLDEGFEVRQRMYEAARPMAADYPFFGTGPGTFGSVFQLYRITTDTYWPEQLHNDWLETRITFGGAGSALIALAFLVVVLRWFARGGIHGGRRFVALIWLALAGCLAHARFDFPFQMHSLVFLFLLLCAILFTLSRRP
jgi:hypothetical protein